MNFLRLEKSVCTNQVEPQDNALVKWPQPESDLGSGFHKNPIRSKFNGHHRRVLCCKYEYWIFLQFLRPLFVYNHCFNNKSNKKLSKEGGAKRWANSSCKDVIIVRRPGPSTELPCSKEGARAMMRLFALCLLFISWQWFCPTPCQSSQATTAKGLECLKENVYGTILKWAFPLFRGRSCSANCARVRLIGSMGMECAWQWV